jgi:hypothetical protein
MTIMLTGASIDTFLVIMGGHTKEMIQLDLCFSGILRCVKSRKSADLIYTVAEA